MEKQEKIQYWLKSAKLDWKVANNLYEKKDFSYSLYFGHLTLEKILKALYVDRFDEPPPFTHRLTYLAEKLSLNLTEDQIDLLEIATDFNLEARYPDEKFSFQKRCTESFTREYIDKIKEMKKWLLKQIK